MKSKVLSIAVRLFAYLFSYLGLLIQYIYIFNPRYSNGQFSVSLSLPISYQIEGYLQILGLIAFPLLLLLTWRDAQKMPSSLGSRFHNTDFVLVIIGSLHILMVLSVLMIENEGTLKLYANPLMLFVWFVLALKTTFVRFAHKTLVRTVCWVEFYKRNSLSNALSWALTSALFGTGGLFFLQTVLVYPYALNNVLLRTFLISMAIFQICFLTGLTTCCQTLNAQQQSYEEKLGVAAAEFAQATVEKIKAERFKIELITNVSHDIRTPLTAILNYIDLIKQLQLSDEQLVQYLDIIEGRSLRLKAMLGDLMEASKLDSGNLESCPQALDLAELARQIYGEFEAALSANQLMFIFEQSEQEAWVWVDGKHLWRVMENIFGNAAKYSMPGTRVYADITEEKDRVRFVLKNISKDALNTPADVLMEQFVRGDRSRHSEGSGLGLYIARSLTELIGGEFKMDIIGDLFQITLILPQAQPEAANSKKLCILGEAIHDRDDDISVDDQSLASAGVGHIG